VIALWEGKKHKGEYKIRPYWFCKEEGQGKDGGT
jgi:hypothetical protein